MLAGLLTIIYALFTFVIHYYTHIVTHMSYKNTTDLRPFTKFYK